MIDRSEARIRQDLEQLARFTSTPGEGITRLPFSQAARDAVDYLSARMAAEKLAVREDAAGNLIGRRPGKDPGAPAVVLASHYDSVPHGGNFDGMAGIVAGLEVVRMLEESGVELQNPIEVIATNDEEGMRFGTGYFGSKAMLGLLDRRDLSKYRDADGVSIAEAMWSWGLEADCIGKAARRPSEIAAFLEIHVEQGPVLEMVGAELGIVEDIVGIRRLAARIDGRPDHAGTAPMDLRVDALDCAAEVIAEISKWAVQAGEGTVATVGALSVLPGAVNVVPRQVEFSVDIRSANGEKIDWIEGNIGENMKAVCTRKGAQWRQERTLNTPPGRMSRSLRALLESSCQQCGYSWLPIASGAGHDSLQMSTEVETAMVFVPSKGGRSHCPEEWTDYRDLAKAAHVVYNMVKTAWGKSE